MAITSTQVLSIAAPIDIVHLGRSMLIGILAHRTALQEIPTGTLCPRNDMVDGAVLTPAPGPATTGRVPLLISIKCFD